MGGNKEDFFSTVTISILCSFGTRGPREDSEKLRPMRPVCLEDDVRDIESLGGSPPSITPSHSRSPSRNIPLVRTYPRPPSGPFLRLPRADADRFVVRIVPPRLSRDLTADTSLHDDSAIVQHPRRTEGR